MPGVPHRVDGAPAPARTGDAPVPYSRLMALQCEATLLITRHGDAGYEHPHVLSDSGGWLTGKGKAQTRELAEGLRSRRVALVYTSTMDRAVESAAIAGDVLGVPVRTVEGLEEYSVGLLAGRENDDQELRGIYSAWLAGHVGTRIPGGESGTEVIERYSEALQGIADLHRGETVLVFSHGGVMSLCIPRLGANVRDDLAAQQYLPNCATAEVAIGDDGFHVVSWPGTDNRAVV